MKNNRIPKKPHTITLSPRLVVNVVTMAVTLCMLAASATAWLTVNRIAHSNGVEMEVAGTSNLVIAKDTPGQLNDPNYTTYSVTFTENNNKYEPVTHDYNNEYGSAVHLIYLTNPVDIDPETGFAGDDEEGGYAYEETYEAVPEAANSAYYKDYKVYIASAGGQLDGTDLTVKLSWDEATVTVTDLALTAEFYFKMPGDTNYTLAGALNLACYDNRYSRGSREIVDSGEYEATGLDELTLYTGYIPACSTSGGEIAIIMRVYYDGALLDENGIAYVRSGALTQRKFGFNVKFEAVEASAAEAWWPVE